MNATKHFVGTVGFVLCAALFGALTGRADEVSADVSVVTIHTDSDFYAPLSSYGQWQVVGSYGSCWIPGGVAAGWSPYSNGYWQQTDAGWYWASDEPWGWATYHYGRWDLSPQYGWYWVPQTQWAPAWVSWREGGGYVGWAPLGPSDRDVAEARGYVFVEERQFLQPVRPGTVIVNTTIINRMTINKGPSTTVIEQASGRKVPTVAVRQLRNQEEAKVPVNHPAPAAASPPTVQSPARTQVEKAIPASEPQPVEKPAVTTAAPQPTATQNQTQQADEQKQAAKLNEENRVRQEKAPEAPNEQPKPIPGAFQARPETRPDAQVEPKPAPDRPVATKDPTEQKSDKDDKKQD